MITSATNPKIKHLQKLIRDRKYRYQQAQFVAEGYRQLEGVSNILGLYLSSSARKPEIDIEPDKLHIVDKKIFDRLADTENSQGILAVCALDYETTLDKTKRYVLLDALQDPGNVGTIIRTAAAFGYDGVIVTGGCVDPFSPKVVRASMGAVFQCAIVLLDGFSALKDCCVVAADLDGQDIASLQPGSSYILAIGSEARGLSPELRPWVNQTVTIPLCNSSVNSLNAAVAAGIVMYTLNLHMRR
jgi:TrmH family RNA methyltransferase